MNSRIPEQPPVIPGFTYIRHLGSGGFADVFLFREVHLNRMVAIKVLSGELSQDTIGQFTDEANLMARLSNHPSIVTVHRAGVCDDNRPYLVMEYCSQPNLDRRYRSTRFTEAETLSIGIEIAGAVETVHRAGILHRDIKPANILTTDYGRPALTDFGIAATIGTGARGMSVPWAPPETFGPGAPTDERSDIYSLAATLYTLLAGHTPYELPGQSNTTADLIQRIQHAAVSPINRIDVSEPFQAVLARAMAKQPADRYASASQLARALQRVQGQLALPQTRLEVQDANYSPHEVDGNTRVHAGALDEPTQTVFKPTVTVSAPPEHKSRKIIAIVAGAAVLIAALTTMFIWISRPDPTAGSEAIPSPASSKPASQSPPSRGPSGKSKVLESLPSGPPLSPSLAIVPLRKTTEDERLMYLVDTTGKKRPVRLSAPSGTLANPMIQSGRNTIIFRRGVELEVMASDGSDARPLTSREPGGCNEIVGASWNQSDPRVLALICRSRSGKHQLIVTHADGKRIRRIAVGNDRLGDDITISPDGKKVLYWSSTVPNGDGGSLYTARIDGRGKPTRLTSGKRGWDSDPSWSPDGRQIAFRRMVGGKNGNFDVYMVNADGSGERVIANTKAIDKKPSWSPDGERLLIVSNRKSAHGRAGTDWDLWLTRVDDGKIIRRLGLRAQQITTPTWAYR